MMLKRSFSWRWAAALSGIAVLLVAIAALQYRWNAQIRQATEVRMGADLESAMMNWHLDLYLANGESHLVSHVMSPQFRICLHRALTETCIVALIMNGLSTTRTSSGLWKGCPFIRPSRRTDFTT